MGNKLLVKVFSGEFISDFMVETSQEFFTALPDVAALPDDSYTQKT